MTTERKHASAGFARPVPANPLISDHATDTLSNCRDVLSALQSVELAERLITAEAASGMWLMQQAVIEALRYEANRAHGGEPALDAWPAADEVGGADGQA